MSLMEATFPASSAFFGSDIVLEGVPARHQEEAIASLQGSSFIRHEPPMNRKFVLEPKKSGTLVASIVQSNDFTDRVFNSLVALKVAVSKYAMHLSHEERHRIFAQLDSVINTDDWHESDELPKVSAFEDFLKWMIYSKYFRWMSIGVSDEGTLLVAWKTKRVLLTANFSGKSGIDSVRWTAQIMSEKGESGHAVGKCPLRLFAEQAMFYLHGAEEHEAQQHQ